jgi:hypothetical protein
MEQAGFSVKFRDGYCIEYDLECFDNKKRFTCEVKFDRMAQSTGNIAIEMHNTRHDKPSGLSATKADIWVIVVMDGNHKVAFAINTDRLRRFVESNEPKKKVEYGGEENARIYLYPDSILEDLFERLDNCEPEEIKRRIRKLVKS